MEQLLLNIKDKELILKHLGKSEELIEYVNDRLGHDRRYAINSSKIKKELGWSPCYKFEEAIIQTIDWYKKNKNWWESIISGKYQDYYKTQYGTK